MVRIEQVTIGDLLERSVAHEHWVTPIDPNLREALYWGGAGIALAIPVGLIGTPLLISWLYDGFFFVLGHQSVQLMDILRSPLWISVNVVGVVLFGVLYWQSEQLTEAVMAWHWVGTALVVLGALNIVAMTLPLAIVALNLVAWIVLCVLALAVFFMVLAAAGAAS